MNENYPEFPDQYSPQGKLILPAYQESMVSPSASEQTAYIPGGQAPSFPYGSPQPPEQLMQRYASPINPSSRPKLRKRADPAHLILTIAIIVVLIATGALAVMAATFFSPAATKGSSTTAQTSGTPGNSQPAVQTGATVFPSPTATPFPSPTVSPTASTGSDAGSLTLTVTDLPQEVNNNTSVPVTVQTNQTGIQVELEVTYGAPPGDYTSHTQVTDANGLATLNWNIQIFPFKKKTSAQVVVVAQDQNGQQVQSATMNVKVLR